MIAANVSRLLAELPAGVGLVAAAKTRTPQEVLEAVEAGVETVGENFVQEAERAVAVIGRRVRWHFIGHLQRNKVARAVRLFDMIETVDSLQLAVAIGRSCLRAGRVMPALIEVNSGLEPQKSGVLSDDVEDLARRISLLEGVRVKGLMTMGPAVGDAEDARGCFRETRRVFDRLARLHLPGVDMECLSMGMTMSCRVAIEEGATLVRIGSGIFGEGRR